MTTQSKPVVRRPTRDEELRLARRWRRKGDRAAFDTLVVSHLYLVDQVAWMKYPWARKLPLWDDIVQEGRIGLTIACEKFDPNRKLRLSSYAVWWIAARMSTCVMYTRGPVKVGTTVNGRKAVNRMLVEKWSMETEGADGCREALAARLNISEAELVALTPSATGHGVIPIDKRRSWDGEADDAGGTIGDSLLVDRSPSPEDVTIARDDAAKAKTLVADLVGSLDERETLVVRDKLLSDEPKSFAELASTLGVSREWVRQLELRAIKKMRMRAKLRNVQTVP